MLLVKFYSCFVGFDVRDIYVISAFSEIGCSCYPYLLSVYMWFLFISPHLNLLVKLS
jgi:hypothetical protein